MGFVLTKETLLAAKTYMPLSDKEDLASQIASECVRPMKTAEQNRPGEAMIALPSLMEEDYALKTVLLQSVLISYYLGLEYETGGEQYAEYDKYAGGHLLNQIERFKSDRDTKDIAFDLLDDWREFKKMVDTMIYNYKCNVNDPIARLAAAAAVLSEPENVSVLLEELKRAGTEFTDRAAAALQKRRERESGEAAADEAGEVEK